MALIEQEALDVVIDIAISVMGDLMYASLKDELDEEVADDARAGILLLIGTLADPEKAITKGDIMDAGRALVSRRVVGLIDTFKKGGTGEHGTHEDRRDAHGAQ